MRIVSWNICIDKENTTGVVDCLTKLNPDIICLQEVLNSTDSDVYNKYHVKELLVDKLKEYKHEFYTPHYASLYKLYFEKYLINPIGIGFSYGGLVEEGNFILSKYTFKNTEKINLYKVYEILKSRPSRDHARIGQKVIIKTKHCDLQILNIHGLYNKDKLGNIDTENQIQNIIKTAPAPDHPTIILGDFNLLPKSNSIKMMNKVFTNLNNKYGVKTTRPVYKSNKRNEVNKNQVIDYAFTSKDINDTDFKIPNTNISDHLPLILDFTI